MKAMIVNRIRAIEPDGFDADPDLVFAWRTNIDLIDLQDLRAWSGSGGPEVEYREVDNQSVVRMASTLRPDLTGTLPDGTVLTINHGVRSGPDTDHDFSTSHTAELTIEPPTATSWRHLLDKRFLPWQVLLWVASGKPSAIRHVHFLAPGPDPAYMRWCAFHGRLAQPADRDDIEWHDMLFVASDLPGGFESGTCRWSHTWATLRHVVGPLFARDRARFVYSNDRFFIAVAALEGIDRVQRASSRDVPRAAHRARVQRLDDLLNTHAPDLTEWALRATRDANRIALARRLVDQISRTGAVGEALFGDRITLFADVAEAVRNGQAHGLDIDEEPEESFEFVAASALVWVVRAILMLDIGFDVEEMARRVLDHHSFQWACDRVANLDLQAPS